MCRIICSFLQKIFSIKNSTNKKHKIVRLFGIKFQFRIKSINYIITPKGQMKFHNKTSTYPVKVKGSNNIIKFCWDIKKIPEGLNINIEGDDNYVEIHKCDFNNVWLYIGNDKNTFILKEQNTNKVKDVTIDLERGASIYIGKDCELKNGNLHIIVNGDYKNKHKLVIGDRVHIARDTIIRTSDGQCLIDPQTGLPTDEPEDVIIGNDVWIMSRCIILKGSIIPDGSAVAANSLVNKEFTESNILIAGTPARIIKHNIKWARHSYGSYMEMLETKKHKKG